MRTVYEILKEVGLDHKDAVMIDFCYSRVLNGSAPQNIGATTNEAADILNKKTGLYGGDGSNFWSYLALQGRLEEKFPKSKPVTFYVPMTKAVIDKMICLTKLHGNSSEQEAVSTLQAAWENRKVI